MIVFPRENNPIWPLPADYADLSEEGQRKARVNAASLRGDPVLEVASWDWFRKYYLFGTPPGMFYAHGHVNSPPAHAEWVKSWDQYLLTVTAAPRSAAKSTIIRENVLRHVLTRPYWKVAQFLAKQDFVTKNLNTYMKQLTENQRIVEDFGNLKPKRGTAIWSHSCLQLTNGAEITGFPIMGAALGSRPHEIYIDDVEKSDDLIMQPANLVDAFKTFFFNVIFPMAEEEVGIHIIGTLLSRRTFIYWLCKTKDSRIVDHWHRTLLTVDTGREGVFWEEKMSKRWQEEQRAKMGNAAFAAQYLNNPISGEERILEVHPELCTYSLENVDSAAAYDPLNSNASVVTHVAWGSQLSPDGKTEVPIPKRVTRRWGDVVSKMRRYILIDYAPTTTESSDFSAIQVVGFENCEEHRDTIYSLDLAIGRFRRPEIIDYAASLAKKWAVPYIGVEAYPIQLDYVDRFREDLPERFESGGIVPRVIPLKFPPRVSKPEKILGLEWRFNQYRIKLPLDLKGTREYTMLWQQIEDFTEDMGLLEHDDAIDTLAMSQVIGKPGRPEIIERAYEDDILNKLAAGEYTDDVTGLSYLEGMNASEIPNKLLQDMLVREYQRRLGDNDDEEEEVDWLRRIQDMMPSRAGRLKPVPARRPRNLVDL